MYSIIVFCLLACYVFHIFFTLLFHHLLFFVLFHFTTSVNRSEAIIIVNFSLEYFFCFFFCFKCCRFMCAFNMISCLLVPVTCMYVSRLRMYYSICVLMCARFAGNLNVYFNQFVLFFFWLSLSFYIVTEFLFSVIFRPHSISKRIIAITAAKESIIRLLQFCWKSSKQLKRAPNERKHFFLRFFNGIN